MDFDYELERKELQIIEDILDSYGLKNLSSYLVKCMHTIIFDYKKEKDISFGFKAVETYIRKRFDKKLKERLLKLVNEYSIHFRTLPVLENKKVVYKIFSDIQDEEIKYEKEREDLMELIRTLRSDLNDANDEIHKRLEILWRQYRKENNINKEWFV